MNECSFSPKCPNNSDEVIQTIEKLCFHQEFSYLDFRNTSVYITEIQCMDKLYTPQVEIYIIL